MLTKGELLKLLQENKQAMDTPVQMYLEALNDDKGIVSEEVVRLEYSKQHKAILLLGTYEEEE